MNIKDLIQNADQYARNEIKLYDMPTLHHYDMAIEKGVALAKQLNANIDIVKIGTTLMDCQLGRAFKNNIVEKHMDMATSRAEEMLKDYNLDKEMREKIINCIEAHHGTVPYCSIEAEICANADCYRFLHPRGIISCINLYFNMFHDLDQALEQTSIKMKEKYNMMSLDILREELEEYYWQWLAIIQLAKQKNSFKSE